MTAKRKKWRLQLLPMFTYRSMPSQKKAYEKVADLREAYALGGRIHHVNVQVDERDGQGWQTYERVVFPPRKEDA